MDKINSTASNSPLQSSCFSSFCFPTTLLKTTALSKKVFISYGLVFLNTLLGAYHLFRAYQFTWHKNSFLLEDKLKLVECKRLLKQIREIEKKDPHENVFPLLKKCKAMHESIKESLVGKEKFLFDLSIYYAEKNNLDECFLIAEKLSDKTFLFDLLKNIQRKTNHPSLLPLCIRLFYLLSKESNGSFSPSLCLKKYLTLAEVFHSLKNENYQTNSVEEALNIYKKYTGLEKLKVTLDMAKYYQKIGDWESVGEFKKKIPSLGSFSEEEKNSAILPLIDAYAYFNDEDKLKEIMDYLGKNPDPFEQDIYSIAKLIKEHEEYWNKSNPSSIFENIFKHSLPTYYSNYLNKILKMDGKEKIRAYINLVRYCKIYNDKDSKAFLNLALKYTETLPESSSKEIYTLISEIISLECFDEAKNVELMKKLEDLYDNCSHTDEKKKIGREILGLYKKLKMDSSLFFSKYLHNMGADHVLKSYEYSHLANGDEFVLDQKIQLLEKAKELLPLVPTNLYGNMIYSIADAYLEIDSKKSLEILNQYESYQGKKSFLNSALYSLSSIIFLINAKT